MSAHDDAVAAVRAGAYMGIQDLDAHDVVDVATVGLALREDGEQDTWLHILGDGGQSQMYRLTPAALITLAVHVDIAMDEVVEARPAVHDTYMLVHREVLAEREAQS